MRKEIKEDSITSLTTKDFLKLRVFNDFKVDYESLIQGFKLTPPLSSNVDTKSTSIESFFVNEGFAAKQFKTICENYLSDLGLENDVILKKHTSGHYNVISKQLSEYLLKLNTKRKSPFSDIRLYFDLSAKLSNNEKLSFLLGNYQRFYRDNMFAIISSWQTFILMDIINSFSASDEKVKTISHFNVPRLTQIILDDNSLLLEMLNSWRLEIDNINNNQLGE
ncbi:MAG: hypothetical protein ACPGLV_00595 [Bacteroidia bacterium]